MITCLDDYITMRFYITYGNIIHTNATCVGGVIYQHTKPISSPAEIQRAMRMTNPKALKIIMSIIGDSFVL